MKQIEGGYRKDDIQDDIHIKRRATYMNLKGWKTPAGLTPIPRGSNVYIM